ncbi:MULTISPECIES: hypothetical protein [Acinetobacter]|uniref:Uncharacterized protein n=5 Tax=Acinetobacter baumannii TaxID=470 RepID=A0A6I4HQZ8_ACIBA|nr:MULTISPECIES: hypothetical protein [Acinetobacter]EHU3263645.1 hypothetical protein [Acinetobacter baumannii]EKU7310420.1 hypothetical protein [Acinetobacter baumannii]EKU7313819.1 hypothetical protein [Acinetobacter baumannii]KQK32734.1 hypothetical protein AQ483_18895 [Acinetobacter baumannii]KQK41775.1 hypothetical protein AQ485_11055 [Acinetobacter baumannii]
MKILHMIWLPFAYWFSPYKLANNALRGTLKNYGVNLAVIPNSLSQEISKNIIDIQKMTNQNSSVFKKLHDLQILIDFNAITMKKIINHEFKYEYEFTPEIEHIKNIMLKHAIKR